MRIAILILALLTGAWLFTAAQAEPVVKTTAPARVAVGAVANVTVYISWPLEAEEDFRIIEVTPPSSDVFTLEGKREVSSSSLGEQGAYSHKQIVYIFRAAEKGEGNFGAAVVEFAPKGDPEDKQVIRGEEFKIAAVPAPVFYAGRILLVLAVLIAAVFAVGVPVLVMRRREKRRQMTASNTMRLRNEEDIIRELTPIRYSRIEGNIRGTYGRLQKAIHRYVKNKYGVNLPEQVNELVKSAATVPGELLRIYDQLLRMLENVKYAGESPRLEDQDRILKDAEKYFERFIEAEKEKSGGVA